MSADRGLPYHPFRGEIMGCDRAAIILALARAEFARWEERFLASVNGVPAVLRVQRALRAAGVNRTYLLTDGPTCAPIASFERVVSCDVTDSGSVRGAALEIAEAVGEGCILIVEGDRPLLPDAIVSGMFERQTETDAEVIIEESWGMCAVRSGRLLADVLILLVQRDPKAPIDRITARIGELTPRIDVFPPTRHDVSLSLSTPEDLAVIDREARRAKAKDLIRKGVRIIDADRTIIEDAVSVGSGSIIFPGTHLCGETRIGERCTIGPDCWIEESQIADDCKVRYSVVESAIVHEGASIGPYAHLRPGADIGPEVRVGNFVEVKASRLERGVKAGHLSYIGDAHIGERVNVGAGTITCNYDGERKHKTVIENDVFIGSHASLVAPVTIGEGALIAAGSTITEDVPARATAFGRARQVVRDRDDESKGEEP